MGLFRWAASKVRDVVRWVEDKLRRKYTGASVQEAVDVDKVLSEFKTKVDPSASTMEKERIDTVMTGLDEFANEFKSLYPDEVSIIENQKTELKKNLKGIIVAYVATQASLGNESFVSILKMQPSPEKTNKLKENMKQMLDDAEAEFNKKLKDGIEKLNMDLSTRLESALKQKEVTAKKEESDYKTLVEQVESGTLDMENLEGRCLVMGEACECLAYLLNDVEAST